VSLVLLTGDVVLTRSDTFLGKAIRLATRRLGDAVVYNHSGLVTQSGLVPGPYADAVDSGACMVEALWHVRYGSVWRFYGPPAGPKRPEVAIWRPFSLDSPTRSRIAAHAEARVGQRYASWRLLGHLADSGLSWLALGHDVRLFRRINITDRPICSMLVAQAFSSQGLDFGVSASSADPDDIADYVETHPLKYALVFEGRIA